MSTSVWNPDQYARFRDERSQPFFDLMALVQATPAMRVVDLGCGTGELTRHLHRHLGAAETIGLDSSPSMLARSAPFAGEGLRFEPGDIAAFAPEQPYDLVFSNAALHWVPEHPALLARLTAAVAAGGQLAFQVPTNDDQPSHRTAAEVAGEEPFRTALGGYVRPHTVLPPEEYARHLHRLGYREQHVRIQVYGHYLGARDEVVEWVKGSMLTDYQRRLPADLFDAFLARYRQLLLPRLEDTRPYFYPFKRLLAWARR
jgi:trans-aconitate 2-methyltransferase